jgi:hypothetical protein
MNKFFLFSLISWHSFFSIAAPILYDRTIENNSKVTEIQNEKNSIFFLCPVKYLAKENYIEKAKNLIANNTISSVLELKVTLLFFTEDSEYFSGGPLIKLHTDTKDTTFIVNDFEAIFLGFNNFEACLKRNVIYRYYTFLEYGASDVFNVTAQRGITCFKSLDERIPFYQNILKEYFYPNYSLDEQISILKDSLQILNSRVSSLEKVISEVQNKLTIVNENNQKIPSNTEHIPQKKKCSIRTIFIRNEE